MKNLIVMAVIFMSATVLYADVPHLLNYQGRLTNAGGMPLVGTYSVIFAIYGAPTGGFPQWQETHSVTTDNQGLFTVTLGLINTTLDDFMYSSSRYLGITVGVDPELAPRTQLVSCPYALRVETISGARGGQITGYTSVISGGGSGTAFDVVSYNPTAALTNVGMRGYADNSTIQNIGVHGIAYDANGTSNSAAIYGEGRSHLGGSIWAGYFDGWVSVTGVFYAGAKFFKIDDPTDPANSTLQHACVESNEFKNVYDGVVITDVQGNATIILPNWFESLNKDFRYQLTVIGEFAQAIIRRKIMSGRFIIQTDKPNVEVSWQVTGVRKDPYALAHPVEVQKEKPQGMRGKYLHPTEYGVDEKFGVDYATRQQSADLDKQSTVQVESSDTDASQK